MLLQFSIYPRYDFFILEMFHSFIVLVHWKLTFWLCGEMQVSIFFFYVSAWTIIQEQFIKKSTFSRTDLQCTLCRKSSLTTCVSGFFYSIPVKVNFYCLHIGINFYGRCLTQRLKHLRITQNALVWQCSSRAADFAQYMRRNLISSPSSYCCILDPFAFFSLKRPGSLLTQVLSFDTFLIQLQCSSSSSSFMYQEQATTSTV